MRKILLLTTTLAGLLAAGAGFAQTATPAPAMGSGAMPEMSSGTTGTGAMARPMRRHRMRRASMRRMHRMHRMRGERMMSRRERMGGESREDYVAPGRAGMGVYQGGGEVIETAPGQLPPGIRGVSGLPPMAQPVPGSAMPMGAMPMPMQPMPMSGGAMPMPRGPMGGGTYPSASPGVMNSPGRGAPSPGAVMTMPGDQGRGAGDVIGGPGSRAGGSSSGGTN